jgi:hypothetical protein
MFISSDLERLRQKFTRKHRRFYRRCGLISAICMPLLSRQIDVTIRLIVGHYRRGKPATA